MVIKESLSPKIGLFYVINGIVYGDMNDVRDIEPSPLGLKDSNNTHYGYWKFHMKSYYPEYRRLDYDYFPRGRIIYNPKSDEYVVYMDKCLDNEKSKDLIIDEFNLPRDKTRFDSDEHYQCHSCNEEYVDVSENYEGDFNEQK